MTWCVLLFPLHAGFVQDNFVIFSNGGDLYQLSLAQNSTYKLPVGHNVDSCCLALDTVDKKLYWTEMGTLKRAHINGTGEDSISQPFGPGSTRPGMYSAVLAKLC